MREYGGNSYRRGTKENITKCIVSIYDSTGWSNNHQCRFKRGYGKGGLYCKNHANRIEKGASFFEGRIIGDE